MAKAVLNIMTRSASGIRSLDLHCRNRQPDGASEIDQSRSHLNRILVGSKSGISASFKEWHKRTGVKKPSQQAECPYLAFVLSASKSHFEDGNLEDFVESAMRWLVEEFEDELVHAEMHLDETTPHIHAVVAPTYFRKKRVPGRKKKNETTEEFEARKEAARQHPGERQVGRSYHAWSGHGTFEAGRRRFCDATGLDFGEELTKGNGLTTRKWLKERAETNARQSRLIIDAGHGLKRRKKELDRQEVEIERDRSQLLELKRRVQATLRRVNKLIPWSKLPGSRAKGLCLSLEEADRALRDVKPMAPEKDPDVTITHDNRSPTIGMV